jgi:hypothetical protein
MPLDTSIYQNTQPVKFDPIGSAQQMMSLKQMGMQNQTAQLQQQQLQREQAKQGTMETGKALEFVAGLPPEQRPEAYQAARTKLIQSGFISPEHAPEQYDERFLAQGLSGWRSSPEYATLQETKAKTENYLAEALKNRAEAGKNKNTAKNAFDQLAPEKQELIKDTTKKSSDMAMIRNMLQSDMKILQDPSIGNDVKMAHRESMLKTLNSKLGKDVVGAEEANRLAPFLKAQGLSALVPGNPGSMFRAHPEKFDEQVQMTVDSMNDALSQSDQMVKGAYAGQNPIQGQAYTQKMPKSPGGGGTGITNVYAGENAPPSAGVRMMGPDGKVRVIPQNQVGEAIAAGGKRVQ